MHNYSTNEKGMPQAYFWSEQGLLKAVRMASRLYPLQINPSLREKQPKDVMGNQVIIKPCLQLHPHVVDIYYEQVYLQKNLM